MSTVELIEHLWSIVDHAKALKKRIIEHQKATSDEWQTIDEIDDFYYTFDGGTDNENFKILFYYIISSS